MNTPRLLRVILNADLRNGHEGLAEVAKDHKLSISKLMPGEFILFLNTDRTKAKLYGAEGVLSYVRSPSGRLNMQVLSRFSHAFLAGKIGYDDGLKTVLREQLSKKGEKELDTKFVRRNNQQHNDQERRI